MYCIVSEIHSTLLTVKRIKLQDLEVRDASGEMLDENPACKLELVGMFRAGATLRRADIFKVTKEHYIKVAVRIL